MGIILRITFLIFIVVPSLYGSTPIFIHDNTREIWVETTNAVYFEDTSANLSFEEIRTSQNFGTRTDRFPAIKNTNSAYWLKFSLINKLEYSSAFRLEFFDFNTDEISVYFPHHKHSYNHSTAGFATPFRQREINHKNISFKLNLNKIDTAVVFVRIKSSTKNSLKPVIRSDDTFISYSLSEYILFGIFYGILLMMIVYNLLYFLTVKKLDYLFYVLYGLSVMIYLMAQNGTGFQFLWPNAPYLNHFIVEISLTACTIFMLLFCIYYLNLPFSHKNLSYFILGLIVVRILIALAKIIHWVELDWLKVDAYYFQVPLLTSLFLHYTKKCPSRWFIYAFVALDVSFLITLFEQQNILSSSIITVYALNIGIILQFLFLSFSVAESVKNIYKDRSKFQGRLIESLKKNDELKENVNRELEEKVKKRTLVLEEQKAIIQEKNKHILDSIRYAKTIQQAILPSTEIFNSLVNDGFVLYKPRDIVSGDFYWIHAISEDEYLVALGDCTGHGIPGAFMTMNGINMLNKVVSEGISDPALALSALHKNIQNTLKQHENNNKDGMDLAFCKVNKKTKKIVYAGAKIPFVYLQGSTLKRIKATRNSIGGADQAHEIQFENHEIDYSKQELTFYLFSDGYVDQFGGPDNKKFLTSQLNELIVTIQEKPFSQQKEILSSTIDNWIYETPDNFQIDDICLIGIKVS